MDDFQEHGHIGNAESMSSCRLVGSEVPVSQEIRGLSRFSALPFVYIAVWMGGEAVPTAWDRGTVFLTAWNCSVQQPSHSSHCVDKADSSQTPQEGLKIYSPHKN